MREIQFREPSTDTERIELNNIGIKIGSSKNIDFAQSKVKAQLHPVEQQDSAILLLTSSKLLLQRHGVGNYCKQGRLILRGQNTFIISLFIGLVTQLNGLALGVLKQLHYQKNSGTFN